MSCPKRKFKPPQKKPVLPYRGEQTDWREYLTLMTERIYYQRRNKKHHRRRK